MIRQVNEPLARVVADLLKRQDPGKAAQWIQDFKQQEEARQIAGCQRSEYQAEISQQMEEKV